MQWDVSTAVYQQEFSVALKEIGPSGVCFKPDGTKMYTTGTGGDTVDEYDLGKQWDVTTAVYMQEFSLADEETEPRGVYFKPDGTKMYIIGTVAQKVDEYDLGTQWDVTTAVLLQEFSVALKEARPTGVCFKPDGSKMYTVGYDGDTVDEYDLAKPWDISTAVYLQEISVSAKETFPMDVYIKPDGTKMYIIGYYDDSVDEYDLAKPWDVSTAVYLQEISVAAKELESMGLYLKPDGTKMYTVGTAGKTVDEYDL